MQTGCCCGRKKGGNGCGGGRNLHSICLMQHVPGERDDAKKCKVQEMSDDSDDDYSDVSSGGNVNGTD